MAVSSNSFESFPILYFPNLSLLTDQKSIVALSNKLPSSPTFYSGSYDGRIHQFDFSTEKGQCKLVDGAGHTNSVAAIAASDRGSVYSIGMDDTVREMTSDQGFSSVNHPFPQRTR